LSLRVNIRPAARSDADDAQAYYAGISLDVSQDFTEEFLDAITLLANNPDIGSRRYAHYSDDRSLRFWRLDRFPFLVFYRASNEVLDVVRIVHEKRSLTKDTITR
jgi:toxin ParE1/3/4